MQDASATLDQTDQSQTILAANTATTRFVGQNTSGTTIYLNSGAVAGRQGGSFKLLPGMAFDSSFFPVDEDLNAFGAQGATLTLKHD